MFGDEIPIIGGWAYVHPYFPTPISENPDGTEGNDTLVGGDGHDFLNGGPGDDLLIGGEGGDTYVLDSLGDIVQETGSNEVEDDPDEVFDTVVTAFSVDLTLDALKYANIESVRFIGGVDLVAVGTDGRNRLTGDSGNDTLIAMGEDDDLYGRGGNDLMDGGGGSDWYYFGIGDGNDLIRDSEGEDQLNLTGELDLYSDIRTTGSGDDLLVTLVASGEQIVIEDWFVNGRIENIYGARDEFMDEADILRAVSNLGPSAGNDAATVTEDVALAASGNVLGNDSDPDLDPLTLMSPGVFQGTYGSMQFFADGSYAYSLNNATAQSLAAGATAQDTFAYTVSDRVKGNALSASANLVVTINGRNDGPVTAADAGNVSEDGVLTASGNVLANDSDIDSGTTLRVAAPGSFTGTYGTLSLAQNGAYTYTLNNALAATQGLRAGQTANDVFAYAASDGTAQSNGTLTIGVAGANDTAVVSNPIADRSITSGTPFSFAFATNTFTDPEGDALSYTATLADGSALPSWLGFNAATRSFSGTPLAGAGTLQVLVTASDASGAAVTDQFALSVQAVGTGVGDLVVGTRGNDVLAGTAFGDVIDGREGVDRMSGGKGDDFYFLDSTRVRGNEVVDVVVEQANEGYDTVFADADYTLAANVEELRLLGHRHLDGTGNALNNVLVGNDGDNALSGGAGSDTYVYELHGGDDVIDEKGVAGQTDTLRLEGMAANTVRLKQSGNNLLIDFPGRDGTVTIKNWFSSSANRVEQFVFDDGTVWNESTIRSRVGKKVAAVKDDNDHGCGPDRDNDHGHHGNSYADDRRDRRGRDDCDDRDGRSANAGDESILKRLREPVRFSFDAITRALGKPSGSLSAGEIAARWAAVRGYTNGLGDGHDHHDGAEFPSLRVLMGVGGHGNGGFGFEGSTGSNQGSNDFKCFQGLGEGFRKL